MIGNKIYTYYIMKQTDKPYLSTAELADLLGISRVEVFRKIKKGLIPAEKKGRNFLILKKDIENLLSGTLTAGKKRQIDIAVDKTLAEYGETLKLLGQE